eukprot:TRINITY_DN8592_c0_g1_i2.p1 TRINITY_DN8592_c0_g1~~TRINITY_DN8592_c0_g1_i2.p1  ORF type:complete len:147 (+),score=43.45 TRINITY_DN8592_c0_g1_i2:436-876(+)
MVLTLEDNPKPIDDWELHPEARANLELTLELKQFNDAKGGKLLMLNAYNNLDKSGLFAISDKAKSSMFAGYSIITLYISVVLVVGKLIRGIFSGTYYKIIYEDMPSPGPLLKLCACIEISRHQNRLAKEGELYLSLIHICRCRRAI